MGGYNLDTKHTCGSKSEAACTYYRLDVPADSSLINEDCVTIEETTEELYNITTQINTELDFSNLGDLSIEYNEATPNNPTAKEVAEAFEREIDGLKTAQSDRITDICNLPIEDCDLDLQTLVDSCNVQPSTFKDILQTLIDEIQLLKTKVETLEQQ